MSSQTHEFQPKSPLVQGAEERTLPFCLQNGFANSKIVGYEGKSVVIPEQTLDGVVFEDCDFSLIKLGRCDLSNVVFRRCLFLNYDFPKSHLGRVAFDSCNMVGARFIESSLEDVSFRQCNLQLANFSSAKLKRVWWDCSKIDESFWGEALLLSSRFSKCSLRSAEIFKTPLKNIDWRTCDISGLHCDLSSLSGLIVTPFQSVAFVPLLGLVVEDEPDP